MGMLVPLSYDGSVQRKFAAGDILCGFDPIPPATDATVNLSYTAAMVLTPNYVRNPGAASLDTFPTADALISQLSTGLGTQPGVPLGLSFRWKIINLAASLITGQVNANTGATLVRGNVAASITKDFLVTITNGTPLQSVTNLNTVNGSAVVTGFSAVQIAAISVGQVILNAVANLQGQLVTAVNATALSVTLSAVANVTAVGNTLTFSPTYTLTGLAV